MDEAWSSGLDSVLRQFETAWAGASPPRIEDFLTRGPASARRRLLIELIAIDLDRRRCRGQAIALSDYLAQFPELAADGDAIGSLAACEYDLLRREQPHLRPEDYVRQFPGYAEEVRRRLTANVVPETEAPPTREGPRPSLSRRRLGDYELLAELGRGGMGVVHKARHIRLQKAVALKVLLPRWASSPEVANRFQREVEAIGRVEHPNLVRATDAREVDGALFLVMELLEGEALDRRTKRLGPWPIAEACDAIRQAALGLQHAHEKGLVHRDLKPSNLFLTMAGVVKVLDLGLARLREGGEGNELTAPGVFMGTPDYVAPEQVQDSRLADARSDVYSLGCTLYFLLAGRAPFDDARHTTLNSKLKAHCSEPPPRLEALRREPPAELAAVLDRMLAKRPEDRYASAAEVAVALAPLAAGPRGQSTADYSPPAPRTGPPTDGGAATTTAVQGRGKWNRGRWALASGVLLAVALVLAWWLVLRGPGPVAAPLEGLLDVKVERAGAGGEIGWKRFNARRALPLRVGDKLRIVIENVNRPVYLYVIWIDTEGKAIPFHPWDEDWRLPEVEVPRQGSFDLPLNGKAYQNEPGSAGMETILLLARDTPLPRSERLDQRLSGLGRPSPDPAALAVTAWSFAAQAQFRQSIATGPVPRLLGVVEAVITADLPQGLVPDEAMWFVDWKLKEYEPSRAARPTKTVEGSPAEQFQQELRQRLQDLFPWSRSVCFGNVGGQ